MIGVIIVGGGEFTPSHHGVDHAAKIIGPLNVPVREHQPRQASPAGLSEINQTSAQFITRDMAKPSVCPCRWVDAWSSPCRTNSYAAGGYGNSSRRVLASLTTESYREQRQVHPRLVHPPTRKFLRWVHFSQLRRKMYALDSPACSCPPPFLLLAVFPRANTTAC